MSDTRLILHIKGTEAQTTELPKAVIRAAISQGKITLSQLIWSPLDYTWKKVREMPELLPESAPPERLILHVKGTELETRELPKHEVLAAISQGQITQSQLIWSASDNAWKQVRELPELLPDLVPEERLILHVKGTEAETRELPKKAVKAAVSQGEISRSQLIWSPPNQAWKQVREMPDLLPDEYFILHVKGTEAETKELPKKAVRTALSQGEITHSQLIWSAPDHAWKQVRELPALLPTQKLAPAPARATPDPLQEGVAPINSESPAGPVARPVGASTETPQVRVAAVRAPPKVRVASTAAETPQGQVAAGAAPPRVRVASPAAADTSREPVVSSTPILVTTTGDLEVKEEQDGFPLLKWLCLGLGTLILLIVGGNYLLVDQPLVSNLDRTSYAKVSVFGHFGAFVQPNVVVIHIPATSSLTADNLTDFLVALARGTPQNPITRDIFGRVALTSGWTAQYTFSGYSWKELGDMGQDSAAQRKEFLVTQMCDESGQSLLPASTLSEEAREALRERIWKDFIAHFTAKR